jgi:hypothetical protein
VTLALVVRPEEVHLVEDQHVGGPEAVLVVVVLQLQVLAGLVTEHTVMVRTAKLQE